MQNAYFHNRSLAERKKELVDNANELLWAARKAGAPIYNVKTMHKADRSTWTLNMLDDGEGYLFENSEDVQMVEGLDLTGAQQMVKTRDSAFFETELARRLYETGIDGVVLLGVSTHSCVFATAIDAYAHNLRVVLARDAIASHDPRYHAPTFDLLAQEYRQSAKTNQEIIDVYFTDR